MNTVGFLVPFALSHGNINTDFMEVVRACYILLKTLMNPMSTAGRVKVNSICIQMLPILV